MVTKDKMINNNKSKGYKEIYKKAKNAEKCIFCHEEHLREIIWEVVDQKQNTEQNRMMDPTLQEMSCMHKRRYSNEGDKGSNGKRQI